MAKITIGDGHQCRGCQKEVIGCMVDRMHPECYIRASRDFVTEVIDRIKQRVDVDVVWAKVKAHYIYIPPWCGDESVVLNGFAAADVIFKVSGKPDQKITITTGGWLKTPDRLGSPTKSFHTQRDSVEGWQEWVEEPFPINSLVYELSD